MERTLRAFIVTCTAFMLSACATRNAVVRCDGHLEPINAPVLSSAHSNVSLDADEADPTRQGRE